MADDDCALRFINDNLVEVRWADSREQARLVAAHRTKRLVQQVRHIAGGTFHVTLQSVDGEMQ